MIKQDKFDEIDAMFDKLQKDNDETIESFKERISNVVDKTPDLVSLKKEADIKKTSTIKRPVMPENINNEFKTRIDYFLYCLKNVNYGSSNNHEYVKGHVRALNSYLEQAKLEKNSLFILEANISAEINRYANISKNTLDIKGYYDGLNYTYKALKKSKEYMANKINEILKREL